MRIISIVNQKGGCGKTTTAVSLGDCLALHHRKVLVIDLDPQSNATLAMGVDEQEIGKSMYDVFCNNVSINEVIREKYPNFFVAPSRINLSAAEQYLSGHDGRETILKNCLSNLTTEFDYVIIDCPPSIGLLTFNALRACSEAIIPIETSSFSLQGLGRLLATLDLLEEKCNHVISFRALATIFDRRAKFSWDLLDEIKHHFGDQIYSTKIHITVKLKEAARAGKPIGRYDTGSLGFFDYDQLAKEVIADEKAYDLRIVMRSPMRTERGIQFFFESAGAQNVQLVGDFNNWTPNQIFLDNKEGNGFWNKTILLPPGKYQYRYIVDGNWVHDPKNDQTEHSPYGGMNSVVEI